MWHNVGVVYSQKKLKLLSSYSLGEIVILKSGGKGWINDSLNDKGVCRTAQATSGLLKTHKNCRKWIKWRQERKNIIFFSSSLIWTLLTYMLPRLPKKREPILYFVKKKTMTKVFPFFSRTLETEISHGTNITNRNKTFEHSWRKSIWQR